jgi:hypothetical protein
MTVQRTEAEILAASLELGLIDVAEAVAWADSEIAASDVPHSALCDVAMASRENNLDVAHMLRQLPGEIDRNRALRGVTRNAYESLRTERCTPRQVAGALYSLAMNNELLPDRLRQSALWFCDAIDLAEEGHIEERPEQVVEQMQLTLEEWLDEQPSP